MFSNFSQRHVRRILVVEFSPYQILALEISRSHHGPVVLDSAAEFSREDAAGLDRWLEAKINVWHARLTVIVGLVPRRGIIQRESINPRRLTSPGYLANVIEEQQKGRFLSATPFKIVDAEEWTLRAVNALDGTLIPPEGTARPALICGIANEELQEVQQRFGDQRLRPDRIEPGLLSLFGLVYETMARRGDARATAIIVIHQTVTAAYILGKEGVHTPGPVLHGFTSILEQARKELGGKDAVEARIQLENADPVVINLGAKLVRQIGRDLKPVVDSYEMTTGQPVDEIICAYLPPKLGWLAEPLGRVVGRTAVAIDCKEWLSTAGLQVPEGVPSFGPQWMGALSLMAKLSHISAKKPEGGAVEDPLHHRPWHVDCSLPGQGDERMLARRRFLTGTVVAVCAVLVVTFTLWQLYATNSLRADTLYWEKHMTENRKLFDELTAANAKLKVQSVVLESAHELMAAPYQLSDLILNLGRTIPAHMRVERIETSDARVAISGALLEPAEEASATLGHYMDLLRRDNAIGPLFSSISITSLQRKTNSDSVVFEITLRLKRVLP